MTVVLIALLFLVEPDGSVGVAVQEFVQPDMATCQKNAQEVLGGAPEEAVKSGRFSALCLELPYSPAR